MQDALFFTDLHWLTLEQGLPNDCRTLIATWASCWKSEPILDIKFGDGLIEGSQCLISHQFIWQATKSSKFMAIITFITPTSPPFFCGNSHEILVTPLAHNHRHSRPSYCLPNLRVHAKRVAMRRNSLTPRSMSPSTLRMVESHWMEPYSSFACIFWLGFPHEANKHAFSFNIPFLIWIEHESATSFCTNFAASPWPQNDMEFWQITSGLHLLPCCGQSSLDTGLVIHTCKMLQSETHINSLQSAKC